MPLLYGEGDKAFRRLQREILENSDDDSLFACERKGQIDSILASSPDDFSNCSENRIWRGGHDRREHLRVLQAQVKMTSPLYQCRVAGRRFYFAPLSCMQWCVQGWQPIGIYLFQPYDNHPRVLRRFGPTYFASMIENNSNPWFDLVHFLYRSIDVGFEAEQFSRIRKNWRKKQCNIIVLSEFSSYGAKPPDILSISSAAWRYGSVELIECVCRHAIALLAKWIIDPMNLALMTFMLENLITATPDVLTCQFKATMKRPLQAAVRSF